MSNKTKNNKKNVQAVEGYVIPFNIGDMVYLAMGGYIISDIVKTIRIDINGVFVNDLIPIGNVFKRTTEARDAIIERRKENKSNVKRSKITTCNTTTTDNSTI